MTRPNGFSMQLATMIRPRMCDVCTSSDADAWVETLIGDIPQSDICLDCAKDAANLVRPAKRQPVAV